MDPPLASNSDLPLNIYVDNADNGCDEYDNCDVFGNYDAYTLTEIDRIERDALAGSAAASMPEANIDPQLRKLPNTTPASTWSEEEHCDSGCEAEHATPKTTDNAEDGQSRLKELREAATRSESRPFFTRLAVFDADDDSDDDMESEDDGYVQIEDRAKEGEARSSNAAARLTPWFKQPKTMPGWLFKFFGDTIAPLIHRKEGQRYAKPDIFSDDMMPYSPSSFWVRPPEPVVSLSLHIFDPPTLYQPRVFLWLPHFFVKALRCPNCINGLLEKNGAVTPRRITDDDDCYYIVTWRYYCRKGCRSTFRGWNKHILDSLPPYLRLAFPAVLSRKGGVSKTVITQLRVSNQHKMGPSGVRALLSERHTLRFNTLQLQYVESIFELVRGHQMEVNKSQTTLHSYFSTKKLPSFGNFGDQDRYAGFVPSEHYLAEMLNKAIEEDEPDANQHTACIAPDQIAIDDSHKINKHIAKIDGVPIFGALWTCMDSRYIRAQALTLTKAHEERTGPLTSVANSIQMYGYDYPSLAFSDDPVKDKGMVYSAFPSLTQKLTPVAVAYGLTLLELPDSLKITWLGTSELVETTLSSLLSILDLSEHANVCISLDAEWNISRRTGVSILQIAPHNVPNIVYIIPVHKFGDKLPPSLLRLLIHDRVFKIGSAIKADLTRIKKQFPQLAEQTSFNIIDLKEYSIKRGIIGRKDSGTLDGLCEKVLQKYLPKDDAIRKSDEWEQKHLSREQLQYAALDVFASRLIFENATKVAPIKKPTINTPAGTRIILLVQEGGEPAAYGRIAAFQPTSHAGIRVKVPTKSRLMVEIDTLLKPSVAAILHLAPNSEPLSSLARSHRTKSSALTLGQLQASSSSENFFSVVTPIMLLEFDLQTRDDIHTLRSPSHQSTSRSNPSLNSNELNPGPDSESAVQPVLDDCGDFDDSDTIGFHEPDVVEAFFQMESDSDPVALDMLEAHCMLEPQNPNEVLSPTDLASSFISQLRGIVDSPPDGHLEYTRIKKDIFHAFRMIPTPINHGLRPAFLRALRDHMLRWDPVARKTVDGVCRKVFKLTFDEMLIRNPQFIAVRTPRFVPPPSVLVPALQHVFDTFGDALDVKTNAPLFNKEAHKKATAVIELARQGYLSDVDGVVMYEKAGIDKYGLQKWKCLRGTNNVEGGPHADIYKKFGALNAGPRLTVNCLTDHRTWYNLQAYAKHICGVDWDFHHNLGLINRTSFLLNYLSDVLVGAESFGDWLNGDLYVKTEEKFGICIFPESLRIRLGMEPYNEDAAVKYNKLSSNDNWLRKRQGLALPALPPTTLEARKYFFLKIRHFATLASENGHGKISYEAFAQEWNRSADGVVRFYVTAEVLSIYAKSWEKTSNIRATQELIKGKIDGIQQTSNVFAATLKPFPAFLTAAPVSVHPCQGVVDLMGVTSANIPASLSTELAISHPQIQQISVPTHSFPITSPHFSHTQSEIHDHIVDFDEPNGSGISGLCEDLARPTMDLNLVELEQNNDETINNTSASEIPELEDHRNLNLDPEEDERPAKRRRIVPDGQRQRKTRSCRRCKKQTCPGMNDILLCPIECAVPCKKCKRLSGCRGVDGGKNCTT